MCGLKCAWKEWIKTIENADISTKAIAVTFRALQLSSLVLQSACSQFYSAFYKKQHTGKQSLKALVRTGSQLNSFDVRGDDIKEFDRVAKQYHLDYTVLRNKDGPTDALSSYTVFFKVKDMSLLKTALEGVIAARLGPDKSEQAKQSVREMVDEIRASQKYGLGSNGPEKSVKRTKERGLAR